MSNTASVSRAAFFFMSLDVSLPLQMHRSAMTEPEARDMQAET